MAALSNKPCPKCNSVIYRIVNVAGLPRLECGCGIVFNPFVTSEVELTRKWNERTVQGEEKKSQSAPPTNIDYTAALEEELLKHRLSSGFDLTEDDYRKVAVRLNAAIQKQHCG